MATTPNPTITNKNKTFSIFMLPLPAHSHISSFFELAKNLAKKNILIKFCTIPTQLKIIQNQLIKFSSTNINKKIQLVELELPSFAQQSTASYVPVGALEKDTSNTLELIRESNSDLAIIDMDFPRQTYLCSSVGNIPSALFATCSASYNSFILHMLSFYRVDNYPFPAIYLTEYEIKVFLEVRERMSKEMLENSEREMKDSIVSQNISFVLIKSRRELEGKYIDYLSELMKKNVIAAGTLMRDTNEVDKNEMTSDIMEWLDKKPKYSTVLVTFGSNIVLSKEEIIEIAHGLGLSGVNFIWVIRLPDEDSNICELEDMLPQNFMERIKEKGRVTKEWIPQVRILGHLSVGGFVSHCGWGSLMESINCGVPIIALPVQYDQPFNARLMSELGVGVEIVRDTSDGKFEREQIGNLVKQVIGGKLGEGLREKAKQVMEEMKLNGQSTTDEAVEQVLHFMESNTI